MPIDLVIDERESTKPLPELGGSTNGNDGRSNADSASHTDGASTPDVVSAFLQFAIITISGRYRREYNSIHDEILL